MDESNPSSEKTQVRTNGLAIASMVLGIVGVSTVIYTLGVPGIIGLVLGIVSFFQIRSSNGTETGKGLAITGIVTSAITVAILLGVIVYLFFFKMN